jgi:hypothetical protein
LKKNIPFSFHLAKQKDNNFGILSNRNHGTQLL